MKLEVWAQTPGSPVAGSLGSIFRSKLMGGRFDVARSAVAYVTIAGARELLAAASPHPFSSSKWLVGLDDCVTQPNAIELLGGLRGAELRVVSLESQGWRFHPKFFLFDSRVGVRRSLAVIGSANLSAAALSGNAEAFALLELTGAREFAELDQSWESLWRLGHVPTASELADYSTRYGAAHKLRRRGDRRRQPPRIRRVLDSDEALIDPEQATTCWIECGNVTALGRELELKAEQGLFFGLAPQGGAPTSFDFSVSDGRRVSLRLKYQENHMWRLQLTRDVPEVRTGLRPTLPHGGLGRSEYVAVVRRRKDEFDLSFVRLNSREFRRLRAKSELLGTIGRTTAREYGWF